MEDASPRDAQTGRPVAPRVLAVIPARWASSRFPGKLLADLHGRPLLEWVYRRALRIRGLDAVWIATDDDRIENVARAFGAIVQRTRSDHQSGTDRVAEVAARAGAEFVVNLQGDEPLLPIEAVERLVAGRVAYPGEILTLIEAIEDDAEWLRPSVVKAAVAAEGRVLYFSRAPIPHQRDPQGGARRFRHVGIYAYAAELLGRLATLPSSPLERTEGLEQLRWMEAGFGLRAFETTAGSPGVDVPEDLARLRARFPDAVSWAANFPDG